MRLAIDSATVPVATESRSTTPGKVTPVAATGDTSPPRSPAAGAHHTRVTIDTLTIRDFRNIARLDLAVPAPGVAIVGPNGHGKTNLLEAIYYLHALRSVRGARDQDLVRFGAEAFHVAATTRGAAIDDIRVGFAKSARRKKVVLDGTECERLSDALGAVPSVMFSPHDVELISGAPAERRRFLDIALATTSRRYLSALQRYRAALVRRNASLREAARRGADASRAAIWEPALAESGATLWCERVRWTQWAAPRFSDLVASIGERQRVSMEYHSSLSPSEGPGLRGTPPSVAEEAAGSGGAAAPALVAGPPADFASPDEPWVRHQLAAALERDRAHDLRRLMTHSGPHRDDLTIRLGTRALRTFGSAGQQRTSAIALRLLERETLLDRTGRSPLILLDDPFAELDLERARRILHLLADGGMGQTLLVVPRATDVPAEYTALTRHHIVDGVLDA